MLNKEQIKEIIPYQEPFLFVDGVDEMSENSISGFYQTSEEDYYFKGHFVNFPIMPGSLIVEALGQLSTILLRKKVGEGHKKKLFLAYNIRGAQFERPIFPGERIILKAQVLGFYDTPPTSKAEKVAHVLGQAFVRDELKCEVRFSIAILDKEAFKKNL